MTSWRVVLALFACTCIASADNTVLHGYDLFQTVQPTNFQGAPFQGVPLGTFDFGVPFGVHNTGETDTIVRRTSDVSGPVGTTPIQMLALQLESLIPVDFGLGVDNYFITLQSVRGGPASTGSMTITFGPEGNPHGVFSSSIDVFFDVRKGALNGPIAQSSDLVLQSNGTLWAHEAPPGALLINGVNFKLNGTDIQNDFFVNGAFTEAHPTGALHSVTETQTPEPGTWTMLIGGAGILFGAIRRRR